MKWVSSKNNWVILLKLKDVYVATSAECLLICLLCYESSNGCQWWKFVLDVIEFGLFVFVSVIVFKSCKCYLCEPTSMVYMS